MSTAVQGASLPVSAAITPSRAPIKRVLAIDAFRGLTILVMIFVNTLAGVHGMPAWLDHMPAGVDGMTFPDVVFPAFLFIVGMSIPFAVAQRVAAGDTTPQLLRHIGERAIGLLVLGVFMVNAEAGYAEAAMPISIHCWSLLFYGAAILVWNVYRFQDRRIGTALRLAGVAMLVVLGLVYRGGPDGTQSLTPQWWGILGLIGWAYLFASLIYTQLRTRRAALPALMLALGLCLLISCLGVFQAGTTQALLTLLATQAGNAAHTAIALCGVITTVIFFDLGDPPARSRVNAGAADIPQPDGGMGARYCRALLFLLAMTGAAALLRPYYPISKIHATPSWALYSAAICLALFGLLYWIVDIRKMQAWTAFFRPAAANPLLTYIIPYIVYAFMQALQLHFPAALELGWPGLIWAIAYSFGVMGFVIGLNRLQIRLQL
ncbi:DUF5009 domain-containing protein [Oxalobacteraceae bacterium]|nr:DUF5009 domain-containing protein [Oxalobacteraceae bacterium]